MNLTYRKNEDFKRKMEVLDQLIKAYDDAVPVSNSIVTSSTLQLSVGVSSSNNFGKFTMGIDSWGTSTNEVGT